MRKKCHTQEFQLKGINKNIRCKLLQKRFTGKTTECSKHLWHIAIEKYIFSELSRCIFQISQNYIQLLIPKILFMLVLCSFNFYFKITWPLPPTTYPPPPSWRGGGRGCMPCKVVWDRKIITWFTRSITSTGIAKPVFMIWWTLKSPKTKTADGLIKRTSSVHKDEKGGW